MNTSRNPIGWFEIYVQDIDRARNFYEQTLNVKLSSLSGPDDELMLAFPGEPNNPGATGALVKMKGVDSGGGGTLVYFSCADCGVEEARVKTNGGQVVKSKFSIGEYGFITLFTDTEDNMLGLHSMA